jgi:hypothetical protein
VNGGPRLNWGLLAAFDADGAARVPPDLARIWQLAGQSLNLSRGRSSGSNSRAR